MKSGIDALMENFASFGQSHVFKYFDSLSSEEQDFLIKQASSIDLNELQELTRNLGAEDGSPLGEIKPPPFIGIPRDAAAKAKAQEAEKLGDAVFSLGKVALFTVAGGQGTRLGFDGPKGTFSVTPVKGKSLFQVFAEKIKFAQKRYKSVIPWVIMTSPLNHDYTLEFFRDKDNFGLSAVFFVQQGLMPAVDFSGKLILESKGAIALNPDGHGGFFKALHNGDIINKLTDMGISLLSYIQVDNPLVHCLDPVFVGYHLLAESEMSSKMVQKASPGEKVGVFCSVGGKLRVIEYSDMPPELLSMRDESGRPLHSEGNIAVHLLGLDFVRRIAEGSLKLPYHQAMKQVQAIDEEGVSFFPDEANGVKFEQFIFGALPLAKQTMLMEVSRNEEFSPVKKLEGQDSPKTCLEGQLRLFAQWLKAVSVEIPLDENGVPRFLLEISPLFADTQDSFVEHWNALIEKPKIVGGMYIE